MSAVSLGGFSTHDNSIAYFNSVAIEMVIIVATVTGAINYASHFAAVRNRSLKSYWRDEECRVMLVVLGGSIIAASLYLWQRQYYTSLSDAFALWASTLCLSAWPAALPTPILPPGRSWPRCGCFSSPTFWPAQARWAAALKTCARWCCLNSACAKWCCFSHPHAVRTVKINKRSIPDRTALTILAFISVYFITVVLFTFLMMATGLDFMSAFTAVIACITNAGPGLGEWAPPATMPCSPTAENGFAPW